MDLHRALGTSSQNTVMAVSVGVDLGQACKRCACVIAAFPSLILNNGTVSSDIDPAAPPAVRFKGWQPNGDLFIGCIAQGYAICGYAAFFSKAFASGQRDLPCQAAAFIRHILTGQMVVRSFFTGKSSVNTAAEGKRTGVDQIQTVVWRWRYRNRQADGGRRTFPVDTPKAVAVVMKICFGLVLQKVLPQT